jgi:hypothetical protein
MSTNPLQKYFRQPKLYVSLPSKGVFYQEGALSGDHSNVPIFAMSGMDELIMKTPDALFNGEATVKLIESCCPYIKNAKGMPSLDLDTLLVGIRIATYGETMTVAHKCKNCGAENEFDINLTAVIDHYSGKTFDSRLAINEITVNLRPLTYEEMTKFNIENFKLQKMLSQIVDIPVEQQQELLDHIYSSLAETQLEVLLTSIDYVQTPEAVVKDPQHIREWLANIPRDDYNQVKSKIESNRDSWNLPKHHTKCSDCGTEDFISVEMDQSSFFGQGSSR